MDGAINRALRALAVVCEHGPATLTELASLTGLARPTLLRMLRLMADEGFVQQEPDRRWRATMLVWQLGCAVNESTTHSALSAPVLDHLAATIQESVVYAAYEKGWLTYVATAEPDRPFRTHVPLGGRHPALDTITGHAVIAWLSPAEIDEATTTPPRPGDGAMTRGGRLTARQRQQLDRDLAKVAAQGYAAGAGQRWPGMWGAAAPVFDRAGRPLGAIGVTLPAASAPPNAGDIVRSVVSSAAALTRRFGGPTDPSRPE